MALSAFAAERRAAAPRYCSPIAGDRAVSKLIYGCYSGTDRQTDRQTPDSCMDPASLMLMPYLRTHIHVSVMIIAETIMSSSIIPTAIPIIAPGTLSHIHKKSFNGQF